MKLFKLIKSIDYVTYPSYRELVKISNAVGDSISSFRNMLISSIVGLVINNTCFSANILTKVSALIVQYAPSGADTTRIQAILSADGSDVVFSIFVTVLVYFVIGVIQNLIIRYRSNKSSKQERDVIVHEFYNVAIPQLIEVKSILEQYTEYDLTGKRKGLLLLLQAKHEVCSLYSLLLEMRIVEKDKTGAQSNDSNILHDRISRCAYHTFLTEMLEILVKLYQNLSQYNNPHIKDDIADIRATINNSGVFDKVPELANDFSEAKRTVNSISAS